MFSFNKIYIYIYMYIFIIIGVLPKGRFIESDSYISEINTRNYSSGHVARADQCSLHYVML